MTCPRCARFQETKFPELKKRYIDTGKVRYMLRDFPARQSGGRSLRARALRCQGRQEQILFHDRHAVPSAAAVGGRKTDPAADGDRQAGRLHQANLQR
jgi:protein-disulfide isomerase